ncbi:MAG TPA: cell division protein [Rhodopseudomonas sp.]|uniref:cell division protein n=1 Tax=Rhodopseudomonas sp. TaxID=1078 RepID=UPI002ED85522
MDQSTPKADDDARPWRIRFHDVFVKEIDAINARRGADRKLATPAPGKTLEAVGLSMSGGGIRSASVCLGVVQALNNQGLLSRIDYLSTVSGGGYLGSSLSATLSCSRDFAFGGGAAPIAGAAPATDISDTPAVGHLRNYSNYLIPRGFRDVLSASAIILRGLVANSSFVVPVLLLLAAFTAWCNPLRSSLGKSDFFSVDLSEYLTSNFGITLVAGLTLLGLFLLWAVARSLPGLGPRLGWLDRSGWVVLVIFAAIAFIEFQPFVIEGMFQIADHPNGTSSALVLGLFTSWVKTLAAAAAPVTALVVTFQRQIDAFLNSATAGSSLTAQASAKAIKLAVWVAGLALPLIIWVAYLYLSYWAIANDSPRAAEQVRCPPTAISATVKIQQLETASTATLQGNLQPDDASRCAAAAAANTPADSSSPRAWAHTPNWLIRLSKFIPGWVPEGHLMPALYVAVALLVLLLSWPLAPNANSLHRLYRDRLGRAFLFDPRPRRGAKPHANAPSRDQGRDFVPVDRMRLSALSAADAPYHLINAALNIQGSDFANRRGRNADFFVFSKYSIGSQATLYAPTERLEAVSPELDLATAMAISGAAASANMGSKTIRPLTPTLALLNIRLGYWLKNPRFFAPAGSGPAEPQSGGWTPSHRTIRYLWSEISGRLYENSDEVYLTDGGHIENLGIYELLRRQCRLIIAVDAEADSAMHFPSLVKLQRYARIDLGIRISLPWTPIQAATLGCMALNAGKPPPAPPSEQPRGPHTAIGIIDYGGGETGLLVYIKSSLSGDENDYVRDYARRYAQFPHEATGDQFFSEEQFEVYRALGFHIANGLLSGDDDVSVPSDGGAAVLAKFSDAGNKTIAKVRAALGLGVGQAEPAGAAAGSVDA